MNSLEPMPLDPPEIEPLIWVARRDLALAAELATLATGSLDPILALPRSIQVLNRNALELANVIDGIRRDHARRRPPSKRERRHTARHVSPVLTGTVIAGLLIWIGYAALHLSHTPGICAVGACP